FVPEPGLALELDRIIYPDGHEEYEIEIETEDPGPAADRLAALLRDLGIEAIPERRTKLERLLVRLRGPDVLAGGGGADRKEDR
ncbi:MAG: hypothetical protein JXP34_22855, partial [Planctomycetes bacterium]|nr:hypothetical protein [Planctomycetota bacterium]